MWVSGGRWGSWERGVFIVRGEEELGEVRLLVGKKNFWPRSESRQWVPRAVKADRAHPLPPEQSPLSFSVSPQRAALTRAWSGRRQASAPFPPGLAASLPSQRALFSSQRRSQWLLLAVFRLHLIKSRVCKYAG